MSAASGTFDKEEFVGLLTKMMSHAEKLQNSPPRFVPQETLSANEVVAFLADAAASDNNLSVRKIEYVEGRANVIVKYASKKADAKTISFVGSHLDAVPANAEDWDRPPFELTRDGDKVFGRGVTDCAGHVAMISCLMKHMAEANLELDINVVAVFIANEEASETLGVGVDELAKQGEMDALKSGPLFWVDSADVGPTLATAGALAWELTISGKKFHSGCPHKGINAVELGMECVKYLQERFYKDFASGANEEKYKFAVGSSLKPTQFNTTPGPNNQVPQNVVISGDIRVTPFFDVHEVEKKVEEYVKDLNANVGTLPTQGFSRYELPDEGLKGSASLKWLGHPYKGVAVNMESAGYKALIDATNAVTDGNANPFSLTGSLPLIRELQDDGFDVQVCGYGRMDAYHACNEYAVLADFEIGYKVLSRVIDTLNKELGA